MTSQPVKPALRQEPVSPPSWWLFLLESRAALEAAALVCAVPWLGTKPAADPGPVLVIPGFGATDNDTAALRLLIARQGHDVRGWGLGRHLKPSRSVVGALRKRVELLSRQSGRPVTLIGWSLGGLLARQLARANPDAVRQVITMGTGSRFRSFDRTNLSHVADWFVPGWAQGAYAGVFDDIDPGPMPVPTTSIYTRSDGVSRWELCLEAEGEGRENIEVRGSHIGLPVNRAVILAVLDRLAQPDDTWAPFRPPALLASWYPPPAWWDAGMASQVETLMQPSASGSRA
jgi:pimeloyl-ACP methyl ester carboxylesterase